MIKNIYNILLIVIFALNIEKSKAETLFNSLNSAYLNNPKLNAERASMRASREEKREVLKKNESWSLRALLQQNFHPQASWLIPSGAPPYNANQNSAE